MTTGHWEEFTDRAWVASRPAAAGLALCLLAGLLLGTVPGSAAATSSTTDAVVRSAMVQVVEKQIAAFRRDDAQAAFSFAGPAIQRRFGTAEAFIDMVRRDYAPVYRPRSVLFLDVDTRGGPPLLRVSLIGPDGGRWQATYIMSRDARGRWRIEGCTLIRLPGSTA